MKKYIILLVFIKCVKMNEFTPLHNKRIPTIKELNVMVYHTLFKNGQYNKYEWTF